MTRLHYKMGAKISVVIPTCNNRQEFLLETINCIKNQTKKPDEIIIINNGKTDMNPNNYPGCKIFNLVAFAGVAQARNFGVIVAKNDFVAFIDDDDLWANDYLEKTNDAIIKGAKIIINRLDQLKNGKILPYKNAQGKVNLKRLFISNPGITGTNIVINKDIFRKVGGYNTKLPPSEDKSIVIEMLRKKIKINILPDNQAIIRQHSGERLSDDYKTYKGTEAFIETYKSIMDWNSYLWNIHYAYKYKLKSGIIGFFIIPKLFLRILIFMRIIKS